MLLNNIFAELDVSSGIKNIISYTDRLNIGRLQVDHIAVTKITTESTENFTKQVNQALNMFF